VSAVISQADEDGRMLFHCPGCRCAHGPWVRTNKQPAWGWNGSFEKPTFTPSILVRWGRWTKDEPEKVCHSFVTDGRIQFLGDCTHALAGQTVDLPPWDD
jgi:Family of unknown function (DUF6527)